jgi:hypothetical protein
MSHLEMMVWTLESMGFRCDPSSVFIPDKCYRLDDSRDKPGLRELTIGEGEGYPGFYAVFFFDVDGKFDGHGVWE